MAAQTNFDFTIDLGYPFVVLSTATGSEFANDRSRLGVYAARLSHDCVIFDSGRVKNPMTIYARACDRIVWIVDQRSRPVNGMLIVTRSTGFEKYLTHYAKNWTDGVQASSRYTDVEAMDIWQDLSRRHRGGDSKGQISFGTPQRDPGIVAHLRRLSSLCADALKHCATAEPASWTGPQIFESIEAAAEQFAGP